MPRVTAYHRPTTIEEAEALLAAPGTRKVILAGGTSVNSGLDREPIEVVDIQALPLRGITAEAGQMRVGATTTIAEFAGHPDTPAVLADLAIREAPSTLRAAATIGGLVAGADPESELLAGLMVCDSSTDHIQPAGIIAGVTLSVDGTFAAARTARTPGDRPIVAAVARNDGNTTRVAVTGVAATPVLVDDIAALDPPGDFRGSSEYRRHLAGVLTRRVLAEVGG